MSQMFDAATLARGWLSVAIASADDRDRPALRRTVYIELYPEGVRLTATDSYVLLTTFVPNLGHEGFDVDVPDIDEAPVHVAVAIDEHGRGRGLLGHLLGLAGAADKKDAPMPEVRLSLGVMEAADDEARPTFDGFAVPWVVLEHPDHERVKLRTYEGDFPTYRGLIAQHKRKRTDVVALNPDIIGRLAKLGKYHPYAPLEWCFGGADKVAALRIGDHHPMISGLVMPVLTTETRAAATAEADA